MQLIAGVGIGKRHLFMELYANNQFSEWHNEASLPLNRFFKDVDMKTTEGFNVSVASKVAGKKRRPQASFFLHRTSSHRRT